MTKDKRYETQGEASIDPDARVGLEYRDGAEPTLIGEDAVIRGGATIYGDVRIGDQFVTGHNVLVREHTTLGDYVVVGTNTVIDGHVEVGDFVKFESNCYVPTHVQIGSRVFFGPGVTLTNDRYPLKRRDEYSPEGPIIEDNVTLGGGVVVNPGVTIGEGAFVASGAVVTKDIPPRSLVVGVPGVVKPLPDKLDEPNTALNWQDVLDE